MKIAFALLFMVAVFIVIVAALVVVIYIFGKPGADAYDNDVTTEYPEFHEF